VTQRTALTIFTFHSIYWCSVLQVIQFWAQGYNALIRVWYHANQAHWLQWCCRLASALHIPSPQLHHRCLSREQSNGELHRFFLLRLDVPHLVGGPILKFSFSLTTKYRTLTSSNLREGLHFLRLASPRKSCLRSMGKIADAALARVDRKSRCVVGASGLRFQIYFDFRRLLRMAIGLGLNARIYLRQEL